jgi:hypothetical protein
VAEFLAGKYSVPLLIVTFDVFQTEAGQHILAREVTEPDVLVEAAAPASSLSIDQALSAAG